MDNNTKKQSTADTITVGVIYVGYLYFMTHPEKADEIKDWLHERWQGFTNHVRQSLDYWESVVTYSERIEEIRSLPEMENESDSMDR